MTTNRHPVATLQEVVAGLKLQLLTYLLAVEEAGKGGLLPAALMYIYLSGDVKIWPPSHRAASRRFRIKRAVPAGFWMTRTW